MLGYVYIQVDVQCFPETWHFIMILKCVTKSKAVKGTQATLLRFTELPLSCLCRVCGAGGGGRELTYLWRHVNACLSIFSFWFEVKELDHRGGQLSVFNCSPSTPRGTVLRHLVQVSVLLLHRSGSVLQSFILSACYCACEVYGQVVMCCNHAALLICWTFFVLEGWFTTDILFHTLSNCQMLLEIVL